MTASAAALEDPTRWLGVVVTLLGAAVINPAATEHFVRGLLGQVASAGGKARQFLARFIPWFRQDATVAPGTMGMAGFKGRLEAHARGFVGLAPGATFEEKLDALDARTQVLHAEVGELQKGLRITEKQLKQDLSDAVDRLRSEAHEIRRALDEFRHETVQSSASALPVIVVGVVLAGLAPDAARSPIWLWSLGLIGSCAYAIRRSWRILRESRA